MQVCCLVPAAAHLAQVKTEEVVREVVPYVPVSDTSRQSGQFSGQIAPLQPSNNFQVAELTRSEAPPAAAQSSNDLASVLSLYNSGFLGVMQQFK